MSYYTLHIKKGFSKNLHVVWPGEQFKVGPFFLKHPVNSLIVYDGLCAVIPVSSVVLKDVRLFSTSK